MKDMHPEDRSLKPYDDFWDKENREMRLNELENHTPSLETSYIAFDSLEIYLNLFSALPEYDDEILRDRKVEFLKDYCNQLSFEFSDYLLMFFAETQDTNTRLRFTEDILKDIDEHFQEYFEGKSQFKIEPLWRGKETEDMLGESYFSMVETAFVQMIKQYIDSMLRNNIAQIIKP